VLILGIGLAHQYATGAGLFEAGNSLAAKVQSVIEELRAELSPPAEIETELSPAPAIPSSLESRLAEQLAPTTLAPQRFPPRPSSFSFAPAGGCRH
jgi:hypothetical protein